MNNCVNFRLLSDYSNKVSTLDQLITVVSEGNYNDEFVRMKLNDRDYEDFICGVSNREVISNHNLLEIRHKLKNFIQGKDPTTKNRQEFDQYVFVNSLELFPMSVYQACDKKVWNYLTWYVLLDIVAWRWEISDVGTISDRYVYNKARHAFARLWHRRETSLKSKYGKDFIFTEREWDIVYERQSLCKNPNVVNAIMNVMLKYKSEPAKNIVSVNIERAWMKQNIRLLSQSTFEAYSEDQLNEIFSDNLRRILSTY
jgi:hypothetical protein